MPPSTRTRITEGEDLAAHAVHIDPDTGITELVGQLAADSKRLVRDEILLGKLEVKESVRTGARGVLWLSMAFGIAVIALVALTISLVSLIGRLAGGDYWVGALATGTIEVALGVFLVLRGVRRFSEPSYTLGESREEIRETAAWVARERAS
jgi:Putative Actinobacterial Holin-X, holin superfamily III